MSSKLTRSAFKELITQDIAWLEAQPRTLEREHVIQIVRESERYYYDEAQDEAIKEARHHALRPLEERERQAFGKEPRVIGPAYAADIADKILKTRREANQP